MLRSWRPLLAILLLFTAGEAAAAPYPDHPVRLLVGTPPGGLNDVIARSVAQFLQAKLGQPFVVENEAGANSTIAAAQVSKSSPDGYTLLANPSLFVITPLLMSVRYDVATDFTPITDFGSAPMAVGLYPGIPAKTFPDFVAVSKAAPEKYSWGIESFGAAGHMTTELIQRAAGTKIVMVPYKGTSPALSDLIGGHISAIVSAVPNLIDHFHAGTIRPVGVAAQHRLNILPDVPTLDEVGLHNVDMGSWYGLWGPANMSTTVVATLNEVIAEAINSGQVLKTLSTQGLLPLGLNSAEFAIFQASEIAKYKRIIKDASIKLDN